MLAIRDMRLGGAKAKGQNKDLQRLSRQDLLELLVGQMHEGDELRSAIEQNEREIADLNALADRLKEKLDLKDQQIENLKEKLDIKDAQIDHLKKRLDQKDNTIATLKRRLNRKDVLIARLSESSSITADDLEILDAIEHAQEFAEAEAKAETKSETEKKVDAEAKAQVEVEYQAEVQDGELLDE